MHYVLDIKIVDLGFFLHYNKKQIILEGIMILPNYEEIIINDKQETTRRIIKFDKLSVMIYGDAKYSCTEIKYSINLGCRRRSIDLPMYINAINDYFVSHPVYKKYKNKLVNLYDFNNVKLLDFSGLKFSSNEFQIIKHKYPNIFSVNTRKCTIYKEALIGCLTCHYYDDSSDIMSLDSFNGFSGESISLNQSHIINMNKNVLHLNNVLIELDGTNIDYERFFLTTVAPNLRKIKINGKHLLNDKDLLFISGFYNLESVQIGAILSSYEQLQKLEKLRELRYVFCSNENELETTRLHREEVYQKFLANNASESQLKNYLMMQRMIIQNKYQELRHRLYVSRLESIKWQNKIATNDFEKIREELINISNMLITERKNISREKQEYTIFDSMHGLDFDYKPDDEEDFLKDSRPFKARGIKYYVRRKKVILDK